VPHSHEKCGRPPSAFSEQPSQNTRLMLRHSCHSWAVPVLSVPLTSTFCLDGDWFETSHAAMESSSPRRSVTDPGLRSCLDSEPAGAFLVLHELQQRHGESWARPSAQHSRGLREEFFTPARHVWARLTTDEARQLLAVSDPPERCVTGVSTAGIWEIHVPPICLLRTSPERLYTERRRKHEGDGV
jgi:hypothetical protein